VRFAAFFLHAALGMSLTIGFGGCRDAAPTSSADTAAGTTTWQAEAGARAAAKGAAAARAYARSRGLGDTPSPSQEAAVPPTTFVHEDYAELDWLKMMPPEDIEALRDPPPIQHVGSKRMTQIGTFDTVAEVTGRKIKLPGYVVPLETDDRGRMTEFFFVPFFGACIHVPPPPPNQLVHAVLAKPMAVPQIWDPYWLRGVLRTETTRNKVAGSAYSMDGAILVPYDG
jgi:hypothetical protein